ncbi:MAG: hypothetical protein ACOC45_06315 [Alkalispirochaetaceae bacterium]
MKIEGFLAFADRIEAGLLPSWSSGAAFSTVERSLAAGPGGFRRLALFRLTLEARGAPTALREAAAARTASRARRANLLQATVYPTLIATLLALGSTFLSYPGEPVAPTHSTLRAHRGVDGSVAPVPPTANVDHRSLPTHATASAPALRRRASALALFSACLALLLPTGALILTRQERNLSRFTLLLLLREALATSTSVAAALTHLEEALLAAGGREPRLSAAVARLLEGSQLSCSLEELKPPLAEADLTLLGTRPGRREAELSLDALIREVELSRARAGRLEASLYPVISTLLVGALLFLAVLALVLPMLHNLLPPI